MEGTLKRKPGKGLSKSLTFTILTHLRAVVGLGSKEEKWVFRDQDRGSCRGCCRRPGNYHLDRRGSLGGTRKNFSSLGYAFLRS